MFEKNECINSNLIGFLNPTIFDDFKYAAFITCKIIDHIFFYLLKEKSDFFNVVKNHLIFYLKTQILDFKIKRWRIDEEREIKNYEFKNFFDLLDIE